MHISLYDCDQHEFSMPEGDSQKQFYATYMVALDRARRELSIDAWTSSKKFEGASH